ncbi:hypothetical protein LT330_002011 [Penicillium expansum]|uniref:Uncharacterized protein n=1 Tax=Penicillium expansum TaxID=27334 RepID=A0A0A2IFQ2_PENEN|nr:hypothetical protein PEX2_051250 [Penicillium expansum]KAK4863233.1 hypothetical protein LT330_002011 [Penicillium expansum]KGO39105.1 hypothetical protein PEXP_045790 [Penicillium expansum]KGO49427.1 hypothetical protein PEX2_051250 [Penicillium expansum]KGO65839.1 hypothetical protein PEX1_036000 [Penicillium expansum]
MSSPDSSRAGSTASAAPIDDHSSSRRHYDVNSADDQPLLYAKVSMFTPNKSELIIHPGTSSKAQIVAVSK